MRHYLICLIGVALIAASAARAQQGTTTNVPLGTAPGARAVHAPGFIIKQQQSGKSERQIGTPKYEGSAIGRSGGAAGAGTVRSRK
jgi:hypothetical protein